MIAPFYLRDYRLAVCINTCREPDPPAPYPKIRKPLNKDLNPRPRFFGHECKRWNQNTDTLIIYGINRCPKLGFHAFKEEFIMTNGYDNLPLRMFMLVDFVCYYSLFIHTWKWPSRRGWSLNFACHPGVVIKYIYYILYIY